MQEKHRAQRKKLRAQSTGHRGRSSGRRAQGAGEEAQGTGHRAQGRRIVRGTRREEDEGGNGRKGEWEKGRLRD